MSTEIDTRITPALHPSNVREVDGYDEETAPVLAATETAFSTAYESLRRIYATREKVERNAAWTEAQQLIHVDDFARQHLDRITRTFDSTRANLQRGITHLEQELSAPLESKAVASMSEEIRKHVKGLKTEERQKFIQDAIAAGDELSASAVLGAPPYLSGMTADMQKVLLRFWHERQSPEKAKRLKAMIGARDLIERNAPRIFEQVEKAVGAPAATVKKLREANSEAQRALILKDVA